MNRILFLLALMVLCSRATAQLYSVSFGLYTGVVGSFTSDDGIYNDPRYEGRFETKLAPIGLNIGLDYEGVGFMVSPGLIRVGQNSFVVNTSGGQDGLRKIDLSYLTLPFAFKVHLVRFTAFKLSAVASIAPSFLITGNEEMSHTSTKLAFPTEVYPILPSDYVIEYDGVLAPEVNHYIIADKKDFRSMQLFAGAGFRTDWDPSNHWRISVDLRLNYGIYDPRSITYTNNLESTVSLYETPGKRRDMFAQFSVGIARYIEFDKADKERKKPAKGMRRYKTSQYPGQKQRTSRPRE